MAEALSALEQYGSNAAAARALGLPENTLRSRVKKAREVLGDSRLSGELQNLVATGFELKGYSQFTKTAAGEPIWLKTRAAERDYWQGVQDALREAIDNGPALSIMPTPPVAESDIIPWLQIGDAHIGMLSAEAETGTNFDIAIAEREICAAAAALIDEAPFCDRMVINDLGDGTHYETFKAETEASGHRVDQDTRYWKMIRAYIRITRFIIERALGKAGTVDYIANQGNHSRSNDIWIAAMVDAIYGPTGRVNVLGNESPFIGYRMGKTFVLIHHGDKAKPQRLRDIMISDYPVDWGETEYRYIDGGHVHSSCRTELAGCIHESWNNLAPRDKWAKDCGYDSKQMMSLVLRSRSYGELGRRVMPIGRVRDIIKASDPSHYVPPQQRAFAA